MSVFRNIIIVAAIAGLFAGLAMAAMQSFATTPLILKAETYENADAADTAGPAGPGTASEAAKLEPWGPADGFERAIYTIIANVVSAIGFAIIMIALSEISGGMNGWRPGMMWGFAGFAAFTLAPGLGLPPELPAMQAADLVARQTWWLGTVAATASGLAIIAFSSNGLFALIGVALIIAPHIIGAPQPASHSSPIPHELHRQFVVMTTLSNLIFWLILGGISGYFRTRFFEPNTNEHRSLA